MRKKNEMVRVKKGALGIVERTASKDLYVIYLSPLWSLNGTESTEKEIAQQKTQRAF